MQSDSNALLALYRELKGNGHEIPPHFGCSDSELDIFAPHYPVTLPRRLRDFLLNTMPKGSLDIGVYKTCEPKCLLAVQLDNVPFYGNIQNGFFGIGWWTGESDGDGWLYDLRDHRIHAIDLGDNYDHTRESLIEAAYLSFNGFGDWIRYLRIECVEREWLKP